MPDGTIKKLKEALTEAMQRTKEVYILGHNEPDFDSIAASLGLAVFCKQYLDNIHILINTGDTELAPGVKDIIESSKDRFNIVDISEFEKIYNGQNSTLIITDTNKENLIALKGMLSMFSDVIVVDHHQEDKLSINCTNKFIDPTVSSASEMVTRLLNLSKVNYDYLIATYLLAGIMLDTRRYIKNTTKNTHRTAEKLFSKGADINIINQLFLVDFEQDRKINDFISNGTVFETYVSNEDNPRNVAYTVAYTFNIRDVSMIYRKEELARAADKMLKYRIDAAFVIGKTAQNTISISARSKSDIDVARIMSQMGGGGTAQSAGYQATDSSIIEVVSVLRDIVKQTITPETNDIQSQDSNEKPYTKQKNNN